jgi:hypothetical protein
MYKNLYAIVGIGVAGWVVWTLYTQWSDYHTGKQTYTLTNDTQSATAATNQTACLGYLPPELETELATARRQGATGLKKFLERHQHTPEFRDPRKAWVQLDYVMAIAFHDIPEARSNFNIVKCRVKPDSPVYERVKQLQRVLE